MCLSCSLMLLSPLRRSKRCASSFSVTNVFDRNAKRLQRNRAALAPSPHLYDYLKDEVGKRIGISRGTDR